jgi:hypothetical protein
MDPAHLDYRLALFGMRLRRIRYQEGTAHRNSLVPPERPDFAHSPVRDLGAITHPVCLYVVQSAITSAVITGSARCLRPAQGWQGFSRSASDFAARNAVPRPEAGWPCVSRKNPATHGPHSRAWRFRADPLLAPRALRASDPAPYVNILILQSLACFK